MLENAALALSMTFPKELGGSGEGTIPSSFSRWAILPVQPGRDRVVQKHGVDGQAPKSLAR
jgi:hypothetical protein